ncbi:hypothetical protein SteCoe_15044 [Stentor coeruleus]|uniref:Uncharacterized protein n=1 Tax=Stentor coeruleus TaxID=5963 RepID=A0A1R2C4M4_9CILI|nr:hypothetical protein SteCoe_15044 [Stentor coeruleus]
MFTYSDMQNLSSLQNLDTPALEAAKLIDDEILIHLRSLDRSISISDLKEIYTKKIQNILEKVYPNLRHLSSIFWSRSIEDPIVTEEVLAALILRFLLGLESSVELEEILGDFKSARLKSLTNILNRIIASNELKSFNISAFLLFTDFKYPNTLSSEIVFWSILSMETEAKIRKFDEYFDDFMEFLSNNSTFIEYMKDLCRLNEDDFKNALVTALKEIILVEKKHLEWYGVDGFTSYNRRIYIKLFNTAYPQINKAAIFYVLLHELCHYFRRISCLTWEDSRNCSTPETTIDNIPHSETGNIFEVQFFGRRHKFLNQRTCDFLLTSTEKLSQQDYSVRFASINKTRGKIFVPLMRGANIDNKEIVVKLSGCLISKHRGYNN